MGLIGVLLCCMFLLVPTLVLSRNDGILPQLEIVNVSFYGEGMAYSAFIDSFIFGSLQYGTMLSVPRSMYDILSEPHMYNESDVTYILPERPSEFKGSNLLGLAMDPLHDDVVWGCVCNIDMDPSHTSGLVKVNISDSSWDFYDLSHLASSEHGNMAVLNDLAFGSTRHIFVTDTFGYQILKFSIDSGDAVVWNSDALLCTQCKSVESHYDGPNGITYVNANPTTHPFNSNSEMEAVEKSGDFAEYLIVALGSTSKKLLKIDAMHPGTAPVEIAVSGGVLDDMDAVLQLLPPTPTPPLRLQLQSRTSPLKSTHHPLDSMTAQTLTQNVDTIYIVGNGNDKLYETRSVDNWISADITAVFSVGCPLDQPSAVVATPEGLVVYCTNGFGAAPYPLNILTFDRIWPKPV